MMNLLIFFPGRSLPFTDFLFFSWFGCLILLRSVTMGTVAVSVFMVFLSFFLWNGFLLEAWNVNRTDISLNYCLSNAVKNVNNLIRQEIVSIDFWFPRGIVIESMTSLKSIATLSFIANKFAHRFIVEIVNDFRKLKTNPILLRLA